MANTYRKSAIKVGQVIIYKREGGNWQLEYRPGPGKWLRRSLRTSDKALAIKAANEFNSRLAVGSEDVADVSVCEALKESILLCRANAETKDDYTLMAGQFIAWLETHHPEIVMWRQLQPRIFQEYMNSMTGLAWDTQRKRFVPLRKAAKYAFLNHGIPNATMAINLPPKPRPRISVLDLEDMLKVLNKIEDTNAALAASLMGLAGLRLREAVNLTKDDLIPGTKSISIHPTSHHPTFKTSWSERTIPVCDQVWDMLTARAGQVKGQFLITHVDGKEPADWDGISRTISKALVTAGFPHLIPRDFRKSFHTTMFLLSPIADRVLDQYQGHAPRDIAGRHYIQITQDQFRAFVTNPLNQCLEQHRPRLTNVIEVQCTNCAQ